MAHWMKLKNKKKEHLARKAANANVMMRSQARVVHQSQRRSEDVHE